MKKLTMVFLIALSFLIFGLTWVGAQAPTLQLSPEQQLLTTQEDALGRGGIDTITAAFNEEVGDTLLVYEAIVGLPWSEWWGTTEIHSALVTPDGLVQRTGALSALRGVSAQRLFAETGFAPDAAGFVRLDLATGLPAILEAEKVEEDDYRYTQLFSPQVVYNPQTKEYLLAFGGVSIDFKSGEMTSPRIYLSRISAEGIFKETFSIPDPGSEGFQYGPSLAVDRKTGRIALSWVEMDRYITEPGYRVADKDFHFRILLQIFDPDLRPVGNPVPVFAGLGQNKEDYLQVPKVVWADGVPIVFAHYPYIDKGWHPLLDIYAATLDGRVVKINNQNEKWNTDIISVVVLPDREEIALAYPRAQGVGFAAFAFKEIAFQIVSPDLAQIGDPRVIVREYESMIAPRIAFLGEQVVLTYLRMEPMQQGLRFWYRQKGMITLYDPFYGTTGEISPLSEKSGDHRPAVLIEGKEQGKVLWGLEFHSVWLRNFTFSF